MTASATVGSVSSTATTGSLSPLLIRSLFVILLRLLLGNKITAFEYFPGQHRLWRVTRTRGVVSRLQRHRVSKKVYEYIIWNIYIINKDDGIGH